MAGMFPSYEEFNTQARTTFVFEVMAIQPLEIIATMIGENELASYCSNHWKTSLDDLRGVARDVLIKTAGANLPEGWLLFLYPWLNKLAAMPESPELMAQINLTKCLMAFNRGNFDHMGPSNDRCYSPAATRALPILKHILNRYFIQHNLMLDRKGDAALAAYRKQQNKDRDQTGDQEKIIILEPEAVIDITDEPGFNRDAVTVAVDPIKEIKAKAQTHIYAARRRATQFVDQNPIVAESIEDVFDFVARLRRS